MTRRNGRYGRRGPRARASRLRTHTAPTKPAAACPPGHRLIGVDVYGNPICEPIGKDYPLAFPSAPSASERERINKIKSPQACAEAGYIWNPGWGICVPVKR